MDDPTRDGTCIRDYVHVVDLAQAYVLALDSLEHAGDLNNNFGNGQGVFVNGVVHTAREVIGHDISIAQAARPPGNPAVLVGSSERSRREVGWEPEYSELGTVLETVREWHCKYPYGYWA